MQPQSSSFLQDSLPFPAASSPLPNDLSPGTLVPKEAWVVLCDITGVLSLEEYYPISKVKIGGEPVCTVPFSQCLPSVSAGF